MINPAPGFCPIVGPLGPTAGPGSPGNGPGSNNSACCTKNQPRRPILSPTHGYFVFVGADFEKQKKRKRYTMNLRPLEVCPVFVQSVVLGAACSALSAFALAPSVANKLDRHVARYLRTMTAAAVWWSEAKGHVCTMAPYRRAALSRSKPRKTP